eukprot:2437722-Ditylum_brightwellii.AAC.1
MIINIHRKAELYAAKIKPMLAKGEIDSLNEDHKDKEENGDYPTRLVIPATNFMAMFLKINYLGIEKVLDNNK